MQAGKLVCDVYPDTDQAEPDEKFNIVVRIENTSWMIFPFVRFGVTIPNELELHSQIRTVSRPPFAIEVTGSAMLLPHRKFERKIEVSAPVRGSYRIDSVYVETGDFVGFEEYRQEYVKFNTVAVYPRPLENVEVRETLGSLIGRMSVRRFIHEDPILVAGFREYTGHEPMRAISWLQSARAGQLIVRKYDFTSDPFVSVLLDTEDAGDLLETSFSLARSVCDYLEENRIEYDFFMNCALSGANCRQHYFARGLGHLHHRGILKQLAMAVSTCDFSGTELISKAMDSVRTAPGLIIISAKRTGNKDRLIASLAAEPSIMVREMYAEDHLQGSSAEREAV